MSAHDIRILLDAGAMQRCLQAIPVFADGRARLAAVSFERLWAKPGRHFHVSYRVHVEGDGGTGETIASASLLRGDLAASDVLAAAVAAPCPEGPVLPARHWTKPREHADKDLAAGGAPARDERRRAPGLCDRGVVAGAAA